MRRFALVMFVLVSVMMAGASENVLQDPGFERYAFDAQLGYYVPSASAAWTEFGFGRASVRFDASDWSAPDVMTRQQPLGFSPGGTGYEGQAAGQNTGLLILQQDITDPAIVAQGQRYEAWVWLGGSGADDDSNGERKEERGGWTVFWYDHTGTEAWSDGNAMETHRANLDFWGQPDSFVQVSGLGNVPLGARGMRFRVEATTWHHSAPADHGTAVALDNAHFGLVRAPNLLRNGSFEEDTSVGEFAYWEHPASWPFGQHTTEPIDVHRTFGDDFNNPSHLPFMGGWLTYGYDAFLMGWFDDAWSFGQTVDVPMRDGGTVFLSFYWSQGLKTVNENTDLKRPMGLVDAVFEYFDGETRLDTATYTFGWPFVQNPHNDERYDVNARESVNGRLEVQPPAGTDRIALHMRVQHNAWPPARELYGLAADAFHLGIKDEDWLPPATPVPSGSLVNGGFEDGLTGWQHGNDAGLDGMPMLNPDYWNFGSHAGEHALGTSMNVPGIYASYAAQPVRVVPGTTYSLSMWAVQQVYQDEREHVRLFVVDGDWPGVEQTVARTPYGQNVSRWTQFSGSFTPSSDVVWVGVRFLGHKRERFPSEILVDSLALVSAESPLIGVH